MGEGCTGEGKAGRMRLLVAFIAAAIWAAAVQKLGVTVSEDIRFLALAIVVAGALAGGD